MITDRLHGMIFAAITSTPCIALRNSNHKIEYSYEWFKDCGYIKFAKNVLEIQNYIEELKNMSHSRYDNTFAKERFKQIIDIVRKQNY